MDDVKIARALIIDARPLFGEALRACLAKGGYRILGQVHGVDEALQQIEAMDPNLVIVGPHRAETGLLLCRELISRQPTLKIILFTAHADDLLFQADAVYTGVTACVRPETTSEELLTVIVQVMAGQRLFSHEIFALAFQPIELTERERDVLRLMADGKTDREIADTLSLKFNTVRNHTRHILEKLSVNSRQEAIWRARGRGIV
jgi:DNA-binding NarL/FixJ family response regulator